MKINSRIEQLINPVEDTSTYPVDTSIFQKDSSQKRNFTINTISHFQNPTQNQTIDFFDL